QLTTGSSENRRLMAALAAVAVALAGQALYERVAELPRQLPHGPVTAPAIRELLASQGYHISEDDPSLRSRVEQLREKSVAATYQRPTAFAGFLILTLPLVLGWTAVTACRQPWTWWMWAGIGVSGLVTVALCLTHAWLALLSLLLVGAVAAGLRWRSVLWQRLWWTVAGLILAIGLAVLIARSPAGQKWVASGRRLCTERSETWAATWAMIRQHGWLGVGPGNFGRWYPRYLTAAGPKVDWPHNFALELWSTCGVLGLAGILVAIAGFCGSASQARHTPTPADDEEQPGLPWEFYVGGMIGLCLGIFLWALDQPELQARSFLWGGYVAAGRSVVWFLAFALFDQLPWRGRGPAWALGIGVAALLVTLTVSDGIAFPALAQPLWIVAALALNTWTPQATIHTSYARLRTLLPVPLLATACCAYVLSILVPVLGGWWALRDAHAYGQAYHQNPAVREPVGWADRRTVDAILARLQQAGEADPGNVQPRFEYIGWAEMESAQFRSRAGIRKSTERAIHQVQQLDPENKEGYLAQAALCMIQARQIPAQRSNLFNQAADALAQAAERDPTNRALQQLHKAVLARAKEKPGSHKPLRLPPQLVPPLPGTKRPPVRPQPRSRPSP
ncbi:MAG TPA: O-antigen ligase family protein, partial [Gemmataceae bacterium]|nr:O-antigen ligase family protein [Gemmataceae bacterium]